MKRIDDCIGGSLQGYIDLVPSELVEKLGKPDESDGYKVSGEYVFQLDDGTKFYIYDWKCTNLYDDGYPLVSDFWTSNSPETFNIGGSKGLDTVKITKEFSKLFDLN